MTNKPTRPTQVNVMDYNKPTKLISAYSHVEMRCHRTVLAYKDTGKGYIKTNRELRLDAVCPTCRYRMTTRQTKELIKRLRRGVIAYCAMCECVVRTFAEVGLTPNYNEKPYNADSIAVYVNSVKVFESGQLTKTGKLDRTERRNIERSRRRKSPLIIQTVMVIKVIKRSR